MGNKSDSVHFFFSTFLLHLFFSKCFPAFFLYAYIKKSTHCFTKKPFFDKIFYSLITETEIHFVCHVAGTQEDSGRLWHGAGLPPVPGPAGLHAWAHLPWRERPGFLPGTPSGGPPQHDQWVSVSQCWKTHLQCVGGSQLSPVVTFGRLNSHVCVLFMLSSRCGFYYLWQALEFYLSSSSGLNSSQTLYVKRF